MLSIYILILGFISGVTMQQCPMPENIYPCKCKHDDDYHPSEIIVECNRSSKTTMTVKVLKNALNSLLRRRSVRLKLYNIEDTLPSNIFSGIGIRTLELSSCRMDSGTNADRPGLLGLENYLQNLRIYQSDLPTNKLHLGHLKNLRSITLEGNNIPEFNDDWLSDIPPSLKELHFANNNITKFGSHAFSRLNNLQLLALVDYRWGPITRSMFPDNIAYLILKSNALTDLPVDLFSSLPRLEFIYLDKNKITTIDESAWSPIWQQLKQLSLKDNKIVCDDRLNWIMKSKKRPRVLGECSAPKELEKTSLENFLKRKSQRYFV